MSRNIEDLLKDLWNNYKDISVDEEDLKTKLNEWKEYKVKIHGNNLTLDEYTNIKSKMEKDSAGQSGITSYLTNFLERETICFGYSKGGDSHQYMISRNAKDDKETYYVKNLKDGHEIGKTIDKDKADKVFKDELLPLLEQIVDCNSIDELKKLESDGTYKNYTAKQVLRKMVVLNSLLDDAEDSIKHKFIFAYKDDVVKKLYQELCDSDGDNNSYYEMNSKILNKVLNILGENPSSLNRRTLSNISSMLWEYATYKYDSFPTENTPNVIFYGAPGTGKTYSVKHFLKMKKIDEEHYQMVQFHPSFTYEDFIEGIKPTGISGTGVKLELVNGVFKDFCKKAKDDPDNEYYFIADEINRANLSAVFGETLSLLEADYRDFKKSKKPKPERHLIETQYSQLERKLDDEEIYYDKDHKGKFGIPRNIRFIGMMNDVDKSIDSFDLALRRRFSWVRMDCDYDVIVLKLSEKFKYDELLEYRESCEKLNEFISGSNGLGLGKSYEFGHSFFLKIKDSSTINKVAKAKLFDSHLRPTLQEYLRGICESEKDVEKKIKDARSLFTGEKTEKDE